ncbi:hypothetical protein FNU79_08330 [Deinococcus detaillensis]|uniref:Uncharacterized protein n=1 Tax=Deinococcus detaillensis TaxID=2592048 RepID=A0A553V123_9DEIO|nr:hypothetical protein [Deinococcus detaillensis]TSA86168.1 hypothetical protein FNU79_08330 [Deinococcus detaillensis]
MIVLPTLALGLLLVLLQVPWRWSAGLEVLTLLGLIAGIVHSSYQRHRNEFDDGPLRTDHSST